MDEKNGVLFALFALYVGSVITSVILVWIAFPYVVEVLPGLRGLVYVGLAELVAFAVLTILFFKAKKKLK